jgi:uncharacterized protein involved in exopolysaccharide biosynthesis
MTTADAWNYAAPGSAYRPADGWGGRVRYAPSDFITLLFREFWIMAIVFVVIVAAGIAFALTLKSQYTAYSSVSIRIGQEYVYQPRSGDAGRGALPTIDDVVQTEINILTSRPVAERAIQEVGLAQLYPKLAASPDKQDAMDKALESVGKSFEAEAAPDTSILKVSFKNENREVAARMLNAILDAYIVRRGELLRPNTPAIEAQKAVTEAKLSDADKAFGNFLTFNNIGDFEAERDTLKQAQNSLEQQKLSAAASLKDRQGRLGILTTRLSGVQPEQVVSRDVNLQNQTGLNDLQAQRTKLLATYTPSSQAVRDIDQKIADTQSAIASRPISGDSARRLGPNPVYQTLQTDQINLTAEVSGLTSQLASLDAQIKDNTERQLRLAQIEPQFQMLARDRGILQDSAKEFAQREQESLSAQGIADKGSDNIRIVARASPPLQGTSLKKPVAVLALLLAGFTALCVGLLRVFLSPASMTPMSAGRSLDLPVLGSARARH